MATLSEITEGHSRRISQISQRRDGRLQEATDTRDQHLRAVPAAAELFDAFDQALNQSRERQASTDSAAEAARAAALQEGSDALQAALDKAHQVRRDADVAAFEKRRKAEEAAEQEFLQALAATPPGRPSTEAQKVRAEKLAKAKKEFDDALAAAQEQFRVSRDAALVAESQDARDANRGFSTAARMSETSAKSARAAAEQKLAKGLSQLPAAAPEFETWRKATASILADFKREEAEEFERFHREMEALR